ncbi:MAG: arylsulfatase [Pseudomonadota bacterium]
MRCGPLRTFSCLLLALVSVLLSTSLQAAKQPNIVLIVVDDMGWADLGSYGSEISTPYLDQLAAAGLTMSHFRVAPTCSPTRSMLLTGVDSHAAGLGTMDLLQTPNQLGNVNYAGELHNGVVTVAEALSSAGYYTVMAGKWHLGLQASQFPHARGFQRSFTLLQGGASHFDDRLSLHQGYRVDYLEDGNEIELAEDFYSTISYTDKIIQFLDQADPGRPFFAYLAHTAPHDPLQVPDAWLDRYRGIYDDGPDAVRAARIQRQQALGLTPIDIQHSTLLRFPSWTPMARQPWAQRCAQQRAADVRAMEIYAAMIEIVDQQVGRLIAYLDERDMLDNTFVIFMSDNGANAATPLTYPNTARAWYQTERSQEPQQAGRPGSQVFQGSEWAAVSNAPFRIFKGTPAVGGIRVPFIVSGPGILKGTRTSWPGYATDITPTFLELAGVAPETSTLFDDKLLPTGESLVANWQGGQKDSDRTVAMELFGSRAVFTDPYKAVNIERPLGSSAWELYNLQTDPGETNDLRVDRPDVLASLVSDYERYSLRNGIIIPEPAPMPSAAALYAGPCNWWCETRLWFVDVLITLYSYVPSKE